MKNPRTVLTLADGREIDLLAPKASDFLPLDWAAEHLAKENRFNGATPGVCYSVAQHMCEGAAFAMSSGETEVAQYFLLHDVHEAVIKDDTTPKKRALAAIAETRFGVLAARVLAAFDEITDRCDQAIHDAAGLAWPVPPQIDARVKFYDRALLLTEWRDLMNGAALPDAQAYADVAPFDAVITPLPRWQQSRDLLLTLWRNLLPAFQTEAL